MATYLKRFGVPDDQILKLPLSLRYVPTTPNLNKNKVGKKKVCTTCHMKWFTYQDCSVCGMVPYCSRECQRIGWPVHKVFCGLSNQMNNQDAAVADSFTVKAFLLPEKCENPLLVSVPFNPDNGRVDVDIYLSKSHGKIRSDLFTEDRIRNLPHSYHAIYNDNFLHDDSSQNVCILNLFRKEAKRNKSVPIPTASHWKGDIIIIKAKATSTAGEFSDIDEYFDMNLADATEAINFLYSYTSSKGLIH